MEEANSASARGERQHRERRRDEAGAHGPFPPVNKQRRSLEITGGERRGGFRGHSHGDGRRRRRSEAEEESGAPGIVLENLLLSHFVLGRLRLRRGEDADRGGRAHTYTQTQTPPFRTKWRCDNDVHFMRTLLSPGRTGANILSLLYPSSSTERTQLVRSSVCFHAVPLSRSHPAATAIAALPGRGGTGK